MAARPGRGSGRASGARSNPRRRHRDQHGGEEDGKERWLVTYADVLTLLLVLFIVLFSISVVNTSKYMSLRTSLSSAFGSAQKSVLDGGNGLNENDSEGQGQQLVMPGMPVHAPMHATPNASQSNQVVVSPAPSRSFPARVLQEVHDFSAIERAIRRSLAQRGMSGAVRFAIDHRGLVITIVTNDLVFPGNSADLLPGGQQIIAAVSPPLRHIANSIEVDGYTNQVKVSTYPYPTGWELSSARASAVVRILIVDGIAEGRLSAVGYSDQHPLYPPSDARAITLNRRVEVVVRSTLPDNQAAQLQDAAAAAN